MHNWDPQQYLKFNEARLRPALDLLQRIDATHPDTVYDLGCGTGTATRLLKQRWPHAKVTGVDNSATMIRDAAKSGESISWQLASLDEWQPGQPADIIYSNAALHWLPNHVGLFPSLVSSLRSGGTLAVQMPANFNAPSHLLVEESIDAGPWCDRLRPLLRSKPVHSPAFYYQLLASQCASVDIWETQYLQLLQGPDPVKEWIKGSWLKQFLDALEGDERVAFEADYAARVRQAYPPLASGVTLFPFRRLFMVARRG